MKPEPHKQISEIHLHIAENRASVEKYYPDRIPHIEALLV